MPDLKKQNTKLVVIGNGPSLQGFDFYLLNKVDTLGMNAAYRYWDKINWYPDHYVCLDDQLIETHASAIYELITKGKVKSAFLVAKILDYHPDLINFENVYFLESFHRVRHQRVASKGVPYIDPNPYFKESDSSKVTTGAYSVRFGAFLGYEEITILGVDLRYVEILPEAQTRGGNKLLITKTPKQNPNYFFDDYQRVGDKFNIPNPVSHGGNLHIASFEVLYKDLINFGWQVKLSNSNRNSILFDKQILPFRDLSSFIPQKKLSVIVPAIPQEIDKIIKNLKIWDTPAFIPSLQCEKQDRPDLIIAFSCNKNPELQNVVLEAVRSTTHLQNCFDKISVHFVELAAHLDYYEKDYSKKINGRGYKSGPNEQYFELMKSFAGHANFIFYMESDCIPLRQGWLDEVCKLTESDNSSWVIGSYYRGVDKINQRFKLHLNGNALYRTGDPEFISFVENIWRKKLNLAIENEDAKLAYDCFLSYYFFMGDPSENNEAWQMFQQVGHRFRATSILQNISGTADQKVSAIKTIQHLLLKYPETYFAHGLQFQSFLHDNYDKFERGLLSCFNWTSMLAEDDQNNKETSQSKFLYSRMQWHPKILMIDSTPINHTSATGQLKKTFLGKWPDSSFMQVWENGGENQTYHTIKMNESIEDSQQVFRSTDMIVKDCADFNPDVIYFRPVDSVNLITLTEKIITKVNKPLVIHMMDDWPARLEHSNREKYVLLDKKLRSLIDMSRVRLSICDKMSAAYEQRYRGKWMALANGVDPSEFPCKTFDNYQQYTKDKPFVFRYMGALADDMTFESVKDIATAISELQEQVPVCLEVYTMDWCRAKAVQVIGKLPGVSVHPLVEEESYRQSLSEADALVLAYNFDQLSISYIGLSLANKLPECLASGSPVLAYGPAEVASIQFLKEANCCCVIDKRDHTALKEQIIDFINNPKKYYKMGQNARDFVEMNLSKSLVQQKFSDHIREAALEGEIHMPLVVGPYARSKAAHLDETDVIAELFDLELKGSTMIDVGAHTGTALMPFLDKDWSIFAFEPDKKNRTKLLDRLSKHKNNHLVSLDSRCLSDQIKQSVSFYSSEQSTGISGLSSFHETHIETQQVNVTTLSDFFEDREMPEIDFLKIDTEGHDLLVLKGFPWARKQPAVIECEFEDAKTVPLGYTFDDMANFLQEKGYTVYVSEWHPIIRYGIRHDWRCLKRYPCQLEDEKAWGNLLAFLVDPGEENIKTALKKVLKINNKNNPKASEAKADIRHKSQALHSPSKIDILKGENGQLNVKLANNLYRDGDFEASMEANLNLYKKNGLKMYADNALMCAKKIKIPNVETVEQLISLREKQ